MFWVYVLENPDGKLYTGQTASLRERTPMFSIYRTRFLASARQLAISWWPCQLKSHSMLEIRMMSSPVNIKV